MSVTDRKSILRRSPLADRRSFIARCLPLSPIGDMAGATLSQSEGKTSLTWETASDWDNAADEAGVVHESIADFPADDVISVGYPSFDRGGSALEGFWPLHEDSGSTVTDASGNGNDGDYVNTPSVGGRSGLLNNDSPGFDDTNDERADIPGATHSADFTIVTWVKNDTTSWAANANAGSSRQRNGWILHGDGDDNNMRYFLSDDQNSTNTQFEEKTGLNIDTWNMYGIVRNGSTAKAVLNDTVTSHDVSGHPTYSDVEEPLYLTSDDAEEGFGTRSLDGTVSMVRYYNRPLSDAELQALHATSQGGHLETATKSFGSTTQPDLQNLSYSLNGQTIDLKVIGSPGTASEEVITQTLDGSTSYTLSWSSGHTDFRIRPEFSTSDITVSPTFDRGELVG